MSFIINSFRFAGGAAPAFAPSDLASLAAWYDASDTATITHSSGAVSQLNDKEGGNHLTQGTGAWQPTTGATTQNSLNVLNFSSKWLSATTGFAFLDDIYADSTVFYVIKGAASGINIAMGLAASGTSRYWAVDYRASPKRIERINASIFLDPATQLPNNGGWVILGTIGNGTTESGYVDGAANGSITLSGSTETNGDFTIGGISNGNGTLPLVGSVAEVLICSAAVSSTDREKIEGYLAHKWGLTANLPGGHPYKSVAP